MTKKLSFLVLFAAVALCAAPTLSRKNAFLPNATIAVSANLGNVNNSFLGEYVHKDVIGTLAKELDITLDENDPIQQQAKKLLETSTITLVSSISPKAESLDNLEPTDLVDKLMVCVEFPQPLGPLADIVVAQIATLQKEGLTLTPVTINECKGVKAATEDGVTVAFVFSPDGKYVFGGLPAVLEKQLTDAAAAAAPAKLVEAATKTLPGYFVHLSVLTTPELVGQVSEMDATAAAIVESLDAIAISAAADPAKLDLRLGCSFLTAEVASGYQGMVDAFLPQIKAMAPSFANGQNVQFINTLASSQDGTYVNLTCSLTQKDIFTIMQLVNSYKGALDDDDDDDEVEVDELEVVPVE